MAAYYIEEMSVALIKAKICRENGWIDDAREHEVYAAQCARKIEACK